nr:uncharacterized protein LOC126547403 isoform X1 [Dermacentor andersoni]
MTNGKDVEVQVHEVQHVPVFQQDNTYFTDNVNVIPDIDGNYREYSASMWELIALAEKTDSKVVSCCLDLHNNNDNLSAETPSVASINNLSYELEQGTGTLPQPPLDNRFECYETSGTAAKSDNSFVAASTNIRDSALEIMFSKAAEPHGFEDAGPHDAAPVAVSCSVIAPATHLKNDPILPNFTESGGLYIARAHETILFRKPSPTVLFVDSCKRQEPELLLTSSKGPLKQVVAGLVGRNQSIHSSTVTDGGEVCTSSFDSENDSLFHASPLSLAGLSDTEKVEFDNDFVKLLSSSTSLCAIEDSDDNDLILNEDINVSRCCQKRRSERFKTYLPTVRSSSSTATDIQQHPNLQTSSRTPFDAVAAKHPQKDVTTWSNASGAVESKCTKTDDVLTGSSASTCAPKHPEERLHMTTASNSPTERSTRARTTNAVAVERPSVSASSTPTHASSSKKPSVEASVKFPKKVRSPYVSNDPTEINGNENPAWESLRRLSTEDERYEAARRVYSSKPILDSHEDLSTYAYRRRRSLGRKPIDLGQARRRRERERSNPGSSKHCKRLRMATEIFDENI